MTETSTNGKAEKFTRKRGVGFPFLSLGDAVVVIRKSGRQGNEHSAEAFARYMGHETTNSGSFKRNLAALRDWKLITGNNERVVLTQLGQRIAYPTNPDEELQDIREAFRSCAIFYKVYEETAKDEPYPLQTVANMAIRYGVSPASKDRFARSLTESAVTAGFAEMDGGKVIFGQPSDGDARREEPAFESPEDHADKGSGRESPSPHRASSPFPPPLGDFGLAFDNPAFLHRRSWEIEEGSLTLEIRSRRSLPTDAYIQMAKVMTEVEHLVTLLSGDQAGSETTE